MADCEKACPKASGNTKESALRVTRPARNRRIIASVITDTSIGWKSETVGKQKCRTVIIPIPPTDDGIWRGQTKLPSNYHHGNRGASCTDPPGSHKEDRPGRALPFRRKNRAASDVERAFFVSQAPRLHLSKPENEYGTVFLR
ncbi:hypothetical protein GWI33_006629 [Rhynchophorus ferrugineus]|uniref:Uncharacterized protein n=1 Tax=Rhynchophorus ferrugineus TaxID=354439 RepID=A0A834MCT8_RHYFE|nr:hypothetical protein GWI33_006629 [Rhynchophorus ferrugineus]